MIYYSVNISKTETWISRFMWVRAQIDYLQRLPSDMDKQKALTSLPPDLPRTYIRNIEMIDSMYPAQTTKYIQRLLRWLVLDLGDEPPIYGSYVERKLTSELLLIAICLENEAEWPSDAAIPTEEQILSWLGCLVRRGADTITLSHFTVKEFLKMDAENVSSRTARKYLVNQDDEFYILDVSLNCMIHDQFKNNTFTTWGEVQLFLEKYPIFGHLALSLCGRIWRSHGCAFDRESKTPSNAWQGTGGPTSIQQDGFVTLRDRMQRFLSMSLRRPFELWAICHAYLEIAYEMENVAPELPIQ